MAEEIKKTKKKKKKAFFVVLRWTLLTLIVAAAACAFIISKNLKTVEEVFTDQYVASAENSVACYTGEITIERGVLGKIKSREIVYTPADPIIRGTAVSLSDQDEKDEDGNIVYNKIKIGEDIYYIAPNQLVSKAEDVVLETDKYVRTSVTIYSEKDDITIAGFAKKGSHLSIIGFDTINEDGSVDMYKVNYDGVEGWVFSKYLVDDQASADAVSEYAALNEDAIYSMELYGGDPSVLDYYPVEKPSFEDNVLIEDARTMYLGIGATTTIDSYIAVALENGVNAICVDIFDDIIGFESEAAEKYCPTGYKNTYYDAENYGAMIQKIKDAGLYVIGRIVCFKDSFYAADHPENCISYRGTGWPSAYSRDMWEFKVALAVEAVEKFGFNEIQFDYVRFPESSYSMSKSGIADFKNTYNETKSEAIQNFLIYACDMIHRAGAYVSADVFGEACYGYVTAYGQYWPAISNVVDVISAMPYVDHFTDYGDDSYSYYWTNPYNTIINWAKRAVRDQGLIGTPAIARTWLTAYDTPYWSKTKVYYGADKLAEQAQALWDAGLTGGFLTWNVSNDITKYKAFGYAWSKDYGN